MKEGYNPIKKEAVTAKRRELYVDINIPSGEDYNSFILSFLKWNDYVDDTKMKNISKYISLILRYKPEVIGITLDEHGWADVGELIKGITRTRPFSMEALEEIVQSDEKQRYSFDDTKTLIRANQGHSIPVESSFGPVTIAPMTILRK